MEEVVLIGKVTGSTTNLIELEYPSTVGINYVRLPRTMVARFEKLGNDRVAVLVRPDDSDRGNTLWKNLTVEHAPLHVTSEHIEIVSAFENGEPLPSDLVVDVSDEVPMWSTTQTAPTVTVSDDSGQVVVMPEGPFDNMLFSGGRVKKESMNWDFEPVRKPAFVLHGDENNDSMGATIARVNNEQGEPEAYHIFNPLYASEKRPAGAYLGTFSASYYPMAYRKGFGPVLEMCAEKGWPAQVIAWNEGKAAAMFVDATKSIDWDKASASLGENWQRKGFNNVGDYRVGFVIYNSLDGSSAYKVQAVCERLACSNGQVIGQRANIIRMKHTVNQLGQYDFEGLADSIGDVLDEAARELIITENMKDITVSRDMFEKLMTICERKKLITKPTIKRDDDGNVTSITRGHMWRVMGQGWTHSKENWVNVENEDRHSLYHVYNILTGALTHKPVWTNGKDSLPGSKLNFKTLTDRLQTVHAVLGDITTKAVAGKSLEEQLSKVPMFSEILY